tara:strand:- start:812 stop:1000 length:189 start_codon:yes stop_codon:yes gene_type:complete
MANQVDSGFFAGFPFSRRPGRSILWLHAASGKSHVSGPGVTFPAGPLDKQQFHAAVFRLSVN